LTENFNTPNLGEPEKGPEMQTAANQNLATIDPLFSDYLPLLEKFQQTALLAKVDLATTFDNQHRERFDALSIERRQSLIRRIGLISEVLENSVRLLGSHKGHFYLRAALKKFGWKIDQAALELIGENDTIEIYGTDFSLKIANMRFLQVCSYTLEDVLSREFFELFERDSKITQHLLGHWPKMSEGKLSYSTDLGPDHLVSEAFSMRRKQFWVESKVLAAVKDLNGNVVGPLYSASVRVLEAQPIQLLDV
jgi:hypothetical protein